MYIISDIHLGAAASGVERQFLAFLRSLRGRAATLIVNGDLFDFWFEWKTVIPRPAFRALGALWELRESGTRILWIAGNHDCWGGDVLREDVGVEYRIGRWDGDLAGWRTVIDHGDGLREVEDSKYRKLRAVFRHPLSIRAFRMLHPDTATRIALATSSTSRDHIARDGGKGLRSVAHAELTANPEVQLIVYGHSHVAALEQTGHGVFGNAGSWLDAPTYLVVTPDRVELREWKNGEEAVVGSVAKDAAARAS